MFSMKLCYRNCITVSQRRIITFKLLKVKKSVGFYNFLIMSNNIVSCCYVELD